MASKIVDREQQKHSVFDRPSWAALRANTPLVVFRRRIKMTFVGLNEHLSPNDVADIYLSLSRLLNLHVAARQQLSQVTDDFLGRLRGR